MPNFWTQDASTDEYYLIKGSDTFEGIETNIKLTEQEIQQLSPYGIGNTISLSRRYMRKLQELNMI